MYGKGIGEILQRGAYGADHQWHWYFLNQDHEGSVTHLTDVDGTIIEKYRYDAFGTPSIYNGGGVKIPTTAYNNRFLFTGREYDGAWMYEYRARMYHSYLGRFMSEDPKGFDAGDYNLFRYCHNDPINHTDPMGLQDTAPTYSPRQTSHERADDRAYNFIMGLMQRQFNSAISAGVAGYQAFSAWSASQAMGGLTMGQITKSEKGQKQLSPMERAQAAARDKNVAGAINQAWKESNPYAPNVPADKPGSLKVEQGGWVTKESSGYNVNRVPPGTRDSLPTIQGTRPKGDLLFWFHTHPNTRAEGYRPTEAAIGDINFTRGEARVPGLIKTHEGDVWIPYP